MENWREELARYPKLVPKFKIRKEKIALIIVDMQYYDAHPDYGLGKIIGKQMPQVAKYFFPRLELVVSNCKRVLNFFRENNLKVFHATFGASLADGSDMLPLRKIRDAEIERQTGVKSAFVKGTFEHQILDELKPTPGELELNKTTRCSFTGTNLGHILGMVGIENVVIVGALTNVCVENTARSAADRGYKTVLVEDATATFSAEMQSASMLSFALSFGMVMTTEELLESLSRSG